MLKGIPQILSPEFLKVLCEMGHSDRIVIADGNFPTESMGKNAIVIRCDGHDVLEIKAAVESAKAEDKRPSIILCETIKGKGVSFMEGKSAWHGKAISDAEYQQAKAELGGVVR